MGIVKEKNGIFNNLMWKFLERIFAQIVTTGVSIVLARLLDPEYYGVIAIVSIFITIANVFVGDGIGSSLVQKKDADSLDFSTLLIFNICFSVILYGVIFISAPAIAKFYGDGYEILIPVLRILGLRIILTGINAIQNAYISRKMMFQKFFWSTLVGTIASAAVGIYMAYNGYGVWALVYQYLTNTTVNTLMMAFVIGKIPPLKISFCRLKELLNFGVKILGSNLIGTGYNQLRALLVGKIYTSSDLAYFDKGQQFPSLIINNINTSIVAVIFPRMAKEQENSEKTKELMKMSIRLSTYIMAPVLLGLAAIAHNFVVVLLTEKWITCIPIMQLLCIYYLFWPIHSLNMQTIKAQGRGDIYLRIELIKKVADIIILVATFKISVIAMTIGMVVSSIISVIINAYPNQNLIGYSLKEQLMDISSPLTLSVIMAAIVFLLGKVLPFSALMVICIQILIGALIYILLSLVTKNSEFKILLNTLMRKNR